MGLNIKISEMKEKITKDTFKDGQLGNSIKNLFLIMEALEKRIKVLEK